MLDYDIQPHILDNSKLYYMLYMIILVYTALNNAFVVFMRCYITRAFSVCCSYYTFLFELVYYCKIYSV